MRRLTGFLVLVLVACGAAEPPGNIDQVESQGPGTTEELPIETLPVVD